MMSHPAGSVSCVKSVFRIEPTLVALLVGLILISTSALAEPQQKAEAKTSLIVIDVQEFYFPGGFMPLDHPEVASLNCKKLLQKFRDENRVIIHVGHNAKKGASFHSDVMPLEGEKIFMKDEVSAFNGTDLFQYLQENEIEKLVICGMQTHLCVEAAVRAAYDLGFECVLVHDACATRDLKFKDDVVAAADVHHSTLSSLDRTYATVVDTETFLKTFQ